MQPLISGVERKIAGIVVVALLAGCLLVMWPFVSATIWAVVLAVSTWPLFRRVLGWLGNRRTWAALVMALAMVLVVLLPFIVVGASVGDSIRNVTAAVHRWTATGPPPPPAWLTKVPVVGPKVSERWQTLAADTVQLRAKADQLAQRLTPAMLRAGMALGAGLMQLALSIFIAVFLFRDGEYLGERLTRAAGRIAGERGRHLLTVAVNTVRGVVYGILGTALAQGITTGIGLLIAGVPNAALLALLAFFCSVVPVVGPALVWAPAAVWLLAQGSTPWAIFLIVWGTAVNQIDNVLKPYLISKSSDMPFVLIFFGVVGGAVAFGFIGVFLGPTLLAVGFRIVDEWNSTPPDVPSEGKPAGTTAGAVSEEAELCGDL